MSAQSHRHSPRLIARVLLCGAAASALVGLAACGGGGSDGATAPPPPTMTPQGAQRFGLGFATSFGASANSDPRDPGMNDIIALSLTSDPIEVP